MKTNRGKQQNGKDWRSLQENQRYQVNISCKDRLDKGQKWYDLTEAKDIKRGGKNTQKNCTKKELHNPDNHYSLITHLDPTCLMGKTPNHKTEGML